MSTYLTIDTSTGVLVGVAREELGNVTVLSDIRNDDTRRHAENLSPMVEQALAQAGIARPDAVVVGTGPGAFTGLRVGLVTARTLAHAWQVPCYGLSSLEVLALAATDAGANETVPVIDARRRELFTLRAQVMGADDVAVVEPARVVAPADLAKELARKPAVLAAVSESLYLDVLGEREVVVQSPEVFVRLLLSRLGRIDAGEELSLDTEPQYLRRPDVHGGAHAQPAAL
ncbi:MAG: tRNA (adenosine(37)-N6)-threonylcarbamoyltransferase complex dimerization subunit type 1 TsaB [Actinomycetaceae bacterium]|nr:tRNA (adenosine(37)-N6)-threonylcarbamoyltransferase complex dimerization subunit type 1 TsaB [Actinomycetaceae bacterium]